MVLSKDARRAKLRELANIEGYQSIQEMLEEAACDAVCLAICTHEGCDYTIEMESHQEHGWCDECRTNTVASAFALAELI